MDSVNLIPGSGSLWKSYSVLFEFNLVPLTPRACKGGMSSSMPSRDVGAAGDGVILPGRIVWDLSEEVGTEPETQLPSRLSVVSAR